MSNTRKALIDVAVLIQIVSALIAFLQTAAGLEIVPPEVVPYLLLAVALLTVVLKFLKNEPISFALSKK